MNAPYLLHLILALTFIGFTLSAQITDCKSYDYLQVNEGQMSNDPIPVPCGFYSSGGEGVYVNQCSPCGMKIADDDCLNTPSSSLCALDGFESHSGGYTLDLGELTIGFCGAGSGPHSNSWIGFTTQTEQVEFLITTSNCSVSDELSGVQFAIVETDCSSILNSFDCAGATGVGGVFNNSAIIKTNNLIPGNPYFILVDGFDSGVCDYRIDVLSGFGEPEFETIIQAPSVLCPDILNPGVYTSSFGSGAIVDVVSSSSTDLSFNWLDPNGDLIATTPGIVISSNYIRGELDGSFFEEPGTYPVQIIDNNSCCSICEEVNLEIAHFELEAIAEFSDETEKLGCESPEVNLFGEPIDGSVPAIEQWEIEDANGYRQNLAISLIQNTGRINELKITEEIIKQFFPNETSGEANIIYSFISDISETCFTEAFVSVEFDFQDIEASISSTGSLDCQNPTTNLIASSNINSNIGVSWTTLDGNIISNPTQSNIEVDQPGLYTVKITDLETTCSEEASFQVIGNFDIPEITAMVPDIITCFNPTSTVVGITNISTAEYEWLDAAGVLLASNQNELVVTQAGEYSLIITDPNNGCSASASFIVSNSTDSPISDIAGGSLLTLTNTSIPLTAAQIGNYTYEWTNPASQLGNTASVLIEEPGLYCLTVTDLFNGCTSTSCIEILQDLTPTVIADAGPDQTITCLTTSVILGSLNTTIGNNVCYEWSGPNNFTSIELQPTVSEAGSYVLSTTNKSNGEVALDTVIVTMDISIPIADAMTSNVINCANDFAILNASSSSTGANITYDWIDAIGASTGNDITLETTECGVYTLMVTDTNNGCTANAFVEVICDFDAPNISIATPEILTEGGQIQLSASEISSNATSILWTATNGNILNGENTLTPTINEPGEYCLTVTNLDNACSVQECVNVEQSTAIPIIADAGPDQTIICSTPSVTLGGPNTSVGNNICYEWVDLLNTVISTETQVLVSTPGSYILSTTNKSNGEVAVDTVIVTIDADLPIASAIASDMLNCTTNVVLLDGSSSSTGPDITYEWFDSNDVIIGNDFILEATECGVYTLEVTDINNGCASSFSVEVSCDFNIPNISIAIPEVLVEGGQIQLSATGSSSNATTNLWTTNDGNILNGENTLTPIIDAPGEYCLTVTNPENGCSVQECVNVEQSIATVIIADAGSDIIINCNTNTIYLCFGGENTSEGSEFLYEWFDALGNLLSNERIFKPLDPSILQGSPFIFVVTNTITIDQASDTLNFIQDLVEPLVSVSTPTVITCSNSQVSLHVTTDLPLSDVSIQWNGPGILSDSTLEEISVGSGGTYTVEVTNLNNGCFTFEEIAVIEDIDESLTQLPEIITCETIYELIPTFIEPTNGNFSYQWIAQEGLTIIDPTTFAVQIDRTGEYTFVQTNLDTGCESIYIISVEFVEPILVNAGPDITLNCQAQVTIEGVANPDSSNFEYTWSTTDGNIIGPSNEESIEVDAFGTYTLTITDLSTGCVSSDDVVVLLGEDLMDIQVLTSNISCPGGNDGSAIISVTGGTPPYTFSSAAGPIIEDLSAGAYTIDVTDATGCTVMTTFIINEPAAISPSLFINGEGNLEAMGTGGIAPYTYDWNTGVDTSVIVNPVNGTEYSVTITDAIGCIQVDSFLYETNAVFSSFAKSLSVFPNPTQGFITVQLDKSFVGQNSILEIFDIQGISKGIRNKEITSDGVLLDLSHLHAGAYILHAVIGNEIYYQKIIVH